LTNESGHFKGSAEILPSFDRILHRDNRRANLGGTAAPLQHRKLEVGRPRIVEIGHVRLVSVWPTATSARGGSFPLK
jgi:hypothetical protein